MKQTTKIRIAPATGAGMTDSRALSFGENPSKKNSAPAAIPMRRLVAPEALLSDTLLEDVSEATPPSNPEAATATASAMRPLPTRLMSGSVQASSLIFSQRTRLPKDFKAPQMETMAKAGSSDQR